MLFSIRQFRTGPQKPQAIFGRAPDTYHFRLGPRNPKLFRPVQSVRIRRAAALLLSLLGDLVLPSDDPGASREKSSCCPCSLPSVVSILGGSTEGGGKVDGTTSLAGVGVGT